MLDRRPQLYAAFGGTEVLFFEVGPLPMSSGTISILASTITGDANLYLGRPGLTGPSPRSEARTAAAGLPSTDSATSSSEGEGEGGAGVASLSPEHAAQTRAARAQ